MLAHVAVGRDEETSGAGSGILNDIIQGGLHDSDHAVDQRTRSEVLAGAGFFFVGVLFQQAFVKVA